MLPGLIGSIVSFLFKAAGQATGFVAEHTWLIILGVVAFLFKNTSRSGINLPAMPLKVKLALQPQ